jgi:FkbM family methyltransferase
MNTTLKRVAKRTLPGPVYKYFSARHRMKELRHQFRTWTGEDEKRLNFYRQFISAGDVVFDVGANLGNRAKIFCRLGAVVVAVEPQTFCSTFLETMFKGQANFHLVKKALGAAVGQSEMMVSEVSAISSFSPDWIRSVKQSGRFAGCEWNRKETVAIDTLDNLIAKHGLPAFVKIDVEGFEDQVLSGLSVPVRGLSFEFTPEFIQSTLKCIEHLCAIGDFQFQISYSESMEFAIPHWVPAAEIKKILSGRPTDAFGDLYARSNAVKVVK